MLAEVRSAAEHLTLTVDSELSAINDPEARDRLTGELERRKQEAQDALQQTALWQQVLNDGIADLTADVDHDLRGRFRAITQHTEKVIDDCDPTNHWAEIGAELENAIATAVGDNFVWAYQRAEALAEEVGRTFVEAGLDAVKMPQIDAREMGAGFGELKSLASWRPSRSRQGHKVVTGMRGSYGGVLMFGMLTSFAGLGMFNPLSLGAGLLLGPQGIQGGHGEPDDPGAQRGEDEHAPVRRRRRRSSSARSRATGSRAIQRQMRDHYRGIANQTTRSLNESLQATLTAAKLEENERNSRVAELERQLNILGQVIDHANKLAVAAPASAPQPAGSLARPAPSAVLRAGA